MSDPTDAQIEAEEDKRLNTQIDDMYEPLTDDEAQAVVSHEQPRAADLVHTSIMLRTEGEPPTYQELVGADLSLRLILMVPGP